MKCKVKSLGRDEEDPRFRNYKVLKNGDIYKITVFGEDCHRICGDDDYVISTRMNGRRIDIGNPSFCEGVTSLEEIANGIARQDEYNKDPEREEENRRWKEKEAECGIYFSNDWDSYSSGLW